jgi:hypothetical protein
MIVELEVVNFAGYCVLNPMKIQYSGDSILIADACVFHNLYTVPGKSPPGKSPPEYQYTVPGKSSVPGKSCPRKVTSSLDNNDFASIADGVGFILLGRVIYLG